jgi:hypothetical protein
VDRWSEDQGFNQALDPSLAILAEYARRAGALNRIKAVELVDLPKEARSATAVKCGPQLPPALLEVSTAKGV